MSEVTIQEMVEMKLTLARNAMLRQEPTSANRLDYAAAVTAAERLAKALAAALKGYKDGPIEWLAAHGEAAALLDELYPGWRSAPADAPEVKP